MPRATSVVPQPLVALPLPLWPSSHISTLKLHLFPELSFPHHPLFSDSLMSVPCHKTVKFLKAGVGFPLPSVLYRA